MNFVKPYNILSVKYPNLCREWNFEKNKKLTPEDIGGNSHRSVWWICKNGHEWKTSPNHRIRGTKCPYCFGHKVCSSNCLSTNNPKLAEEWNVLKNGKLTANDVTCGSNKIVWWKCSICGNEWKARIDSRKISDCPRCSMVIKGWRNNKRDSLAHKYQNLIKEWHSIKNGNLTPYMLTPNSHREVWWICKKGHEWKSAPHDRVQKKCNCPYCAGKRANVTNCLATLRPKLSEEWHPTKNGNLTPYDVVLRSGKKVWWLCKRCGNEWMAYISNRTKGCGCECYRNVVLKNNVICDSMVEALYYLKYKKENISFIHHGYYGNKMGKHKYDFYLPDSDTYIEVTSYHRGSGKYMKTILKKKKYVETVLRSKFSFISYIPTEREYDYVRNNIRKLG